MMDCADTPRQGDLDGRGNLSLRALTEYTAWFLRVCLNQVEFMNRLFALDTLVDRLKVYVARHEMKPETFHLLEQVLQRGEVPRGEAARITGLGERTARDLLGALVTAGVLASDTPKGPFRCVFLWTRPRSCFRPCSLRPKPRNPNGPRAMLALELQKACVRHSHRSFRQNNCRIP